jgi:RNA polymerase sigma factor (sigma-70 family)
MVARPGAAVLRVANQFSLCHDDALDAYQRAFEIYLRKLDTVDPATEGAWLRVVVKHEAMAIRNGRLESVDRDEVDLDMSVPAGLREVDDAVAGGERVDRSVEALRALKPDEARALLLKAEGLSYQEIGRHFGWSYTKVNRSITEGRARFLKAFSGIEAGEACERYESALSALAAGTATSAQVLSIRPHLRHCATCRATVREMRFSRGRRLALAVPFGWLARLLARSDVTTTMYAASNGGGRLGPAAALVGLCLGGVGAGAACVMTGALPAPPLIAHAQSKPKPEAPKQKVTAAKKRREPVRPAERISVPHTFTAATPTATPAPKTIKAKVSTKRSGPKKTSVKASGSSSGPSSGEFGFEGSASASPSGTSSGAVASASSAGGQSSSSSSDSGTRTGSAPKATNGGEFGFEGG